MATLQLNLVKHLFGLTLQGIKKEEYRTITPYWAKRLLCMENGDKLTECYSEKSIEWLCTSLKRWEDLYYNSIEDVLDKFHIKFKEYQNTHFRNGYKPLDKVPRFIIENKGVTVGIGKEEWGFIGDKPMFIIQHGEIIEQFNIK
ncbi:MAG: hypothetical protein PHO12_08605 [Bacteroidales bacterium]|nr:hypothetical protein [Bacteroidales bacterium]MDD4685166.1 hypothetical protein [Bacteroidales bacterium]